jgi:thiamine biosynthesis lipoprotein
MKKNMKITRREFIKITAAASGLLVGGGYLFHQLEGQFVTVKETRMLMGTVINLSLIAESKFAADQAITATFAELERQIAIFDHRTPGTPVSVLNRDGRLTNPPTELVEVLEQAFTVSDMTGGAFDVTVQPLVALYQQARPDLPLASAVQSALSLVDYRNIRVSKAEVAFSLTGMAITLDGIAKGYIVDAGVAELRQFGFTDVFVEAGGDLMASGFKQGETPWRVGVQSPRPSTPEIVDSFPVSNQAVATSGDYMNYYTADLANHHIIDPRSGVSPTELASVTVVAGSTTTADSLATAFMVLPPDRGIALIEDLPGVEALLITKALEQHQSSGFL